MWLTNFLQLWVLQVLVRLVYCAKKNKTPKLYKLGFDAIYSSKSPCYYGKQMNVEQQLICYAIDDLKVIATKKLICEELIALLYCRTDSAKFCLTCDGQVHSTNLSSVWSCPSMLMGFSLIEFIVKLELTTSRLLLITTLRTRWLLKERSIVTDHNLGTTRKFIG